jgi:hypothetical protein
MDEAKNGPAANQNGKSLITSVHTFFQDLNQRTSAGTKATILVFVAIFLCMFWRLGSYPPYFDELVDFGIYVQVNHVFDHEVGLEKTSWFWKSMHTHGAVESPVYGLVTEIGLRLFGLTLFGVRIFPVLLAFLSLILMYFALKKFLSRYLLLCFISLMALSTWYLLVTRSGSISGFSISLSLIAFSLLLMLFERKRALGLAVLAGISAALIPYGYTVIRLWLPILIFLAIVSYKRIEKYNLIAYLSTIFVICSIQISNLSESLTMYFFGRGEGLNTMAKLPDGGYNFPFILQKLNENLTLTFNILLGRNDPGHFWNVNLVKDFSSGEVVLYPKFLVFFLIVGFIFCAVHIFTKRRPLLLVPATLFLIGLAPDMISGLGVPNVVRSTMLLVPLYFLIAYGVYYLFNSGLHLSGQRLKKMFPFVLLLFIAFTSVYQVINYFCFEKSVITKDDPMTIMYREFLGDYIINHPQAKILLHEGSNDYMHSYVTIRWLGGSKMQKMIENSQVKFLRFTNRDYIQRLVQHNYFDIIAASTYEDMEQMIPEIMNLPSETYGSYRIYYGNDAARRW